VAANEQRLYPYKNMTDLQSLRWGIPGFYAEGTTLYVYLVGNSDPNNASMVVSRYSYAFWVEQNFIEIVNLTFRHYGRGMYHQAIYIRGGSDNLVQGNTFALNLYGIAIKHASHRNVIQNNEFYDSIRDWPWDAVYDGTLFTGSGGIRFVGPNSDQGNVIARGNIIRRNIFHDSFDGFGVCPGQPSGATTNETDVYENLVYNVGDDGMETDALCSNVRIWGNTFHDSLTGISLAPNRVGPVYALRNVIYRTFRAGGCPFGGATTGPCSGTAFKFQNQNPGSGPMYLFHNTADAGSYGSSMYISEPSTWPILVSRNNIWYSSVGWAIDNSVDDPVDFDYDDLVGAQGWNLLRWQGTKYLTLGAFCAATGEECHGKNVDPRFANRSVGDYRLLPDSQLIDAGALISGINDNFNGRAPDIGAFEY
jgi:parallel beta-helix repeat protein